MNRKSTPSLSLCVAVMLAALVQPDAGNAKFMRAESIPVARLIRNLEVVVKSEPNNIDAIYTLGRLHSLAFAEGNHNAEVYTKSSGDKSLLKVPLLPSYSTPKAVQDAEGKRDSKTAKKHLSETLRLYRKSVEKVPGNGLYWFSYAWMLEQGAVYASEVKASFADGRNRASKAQWLSEAIKYYRTAYQLNKDKDSKSDWFFKGGNTIVSFEAAEAILKSFENRPLSLAEMNEKKELAAHVKLMNSKPTAVTPIIFPLKSSDNFASLASSMRTTSFDLMGDGVKRSWEWVSPKTGILVWDPNHTGKVKSGRQLFGSVTWWMFWEDGYAPLRALDDNRDGALTGKELRGISVWIDRNGNGISEPGEVISASLFGIRSILVAPDSCLDEVLISTRGIEMKDGSVSPTYDWVPKSK